MYEKSDMWVSAAGLLSLVDGATHPGVFFVHQPPGKPRIIKLRKLNGNSAATSYAAWAYDPKTNKKSNPTVSSRAECCADACDNERSSSKSILPLNTARKMSRSTSYGRSRY
eukprot:2355691-Pyramimonas_sp.AAC.1